MRAIESEAELKLGRVVLECRQRRRFVVFLDLGGSWIHVVLTPLVMALFLTLATFAACQHFGVGRMLTAQAMVFVAVATLIIVYVLYFTAPDTISLALHERGFRYKSRLIRFAELKRIRIGKANSELAEAFSDFTRFIGTFHRGMRVANAMRENSNRATLTVSLEGGRTLYLKNALAEYQESDLTQFLEIIREEYPELMNTQKKSDELTVCNVSTPDDDLPTADTAPTAETPPAANSRRGIDPTCGNLTARDVVSEFARGNYRPASLLLGATREPKLREFYVRTLSEWTGRPYTFETWKRDEPENSNTWLVSGAHSIDWAWQARGGDMAENVEQQAWATFEERLKLAATDLERAGGLNMEDPTPQAFQIRINMGLNKPKEETLKIFDQVMRRCPDHYLAHTNLLTYLCEKWHGSHEEMFKFARVAGEDCDEGSLLPALIVQAHTERWLYAIAFDQDPNGDDYFQQREVRDEVLSAYARSLGSPHHESSPLSHYAANYFAFALLRCGDTDAARRECERIGQYRTRHPWSYLGDPSEIYEHVQTSLDESHALVECT